MRLGRGVLLVACMAAAVLSLTDCSMYTLFGRRTAPSRVAGSAPPPPPPTLEDNSFLAAALAHVDSELALSQMASEKARTPSLVAYAKSVAEERAGLKDKLAAAAQAVGVAGDTNNVPRLDEFAPLKGPAFEHAYVAAELEDQRNNLDSFLFESQNGGKPEFKELAANEVPRLEADLDQATGIVRDLPLVPENEEAEDEMPPVQNEPNAAPGGAGAPAR